MTIRKTLLVIETTGRTASALDKWLRENGRHCLWVEKPDVAIPLLDSNDRICAVLLVDDDPVEDSFINNLNMMRQIFQKAPIITSTGKNSAALEKTIRKIGVFFYHTENEEFDELKTAVDCAFNKALTENLFLTFRGGGGGYKN